MPPPFGEGVSTLSYRSVPEERGDAAEDPRGPQQAGGDIPFVAGEHQNVGTL
jgi:hypothetical protein